MDRGWTRFRWGNIYCNFPSPLLLVLLYRRHNTPHPGRSRRCRSVVVLDGLPMSPQLHFSGQQQHITEWALFKWWLTNLVASQKFILEPALKSANPPEEEEEHGRNRTGQDPYCCRCCCCSERCQCHTEWRNNDPTMVIGSSNCLGRTCSQWCQPIVASPICNGIALKQPSAPGTGYFRTTRY